MMAYTSSAHGGFRAWIKRVVGRALAVIREHRRAYIGLNLAYYGIVGAAMVFVTSNPAIQQALTDSVVLAFSAGPFAPVAQAYIQGDVLGAAVLTFVVNFFAGTLLVLFVPSLFVPFGGVAIGLIRATLWGLLLAPTTPELRFTMIPHSLTLLLEGQGYILAMLAVWVHGRAFMSPATVGAESHLRGWLAGLRRSLWLYVLVALTLAVAALYEAIEVIHIVPRLVA